MQSKSTFSSFRNKSGKVLLNQDKRPPLGHSTAALVAARDIERVFTPTRGLA
jgi:hypothetical protein